MVVHDYAEMAERLQVLVAERLRLRGPTLRRQLAWIGRRAPRSVRRDLRTVAQAAERAAHPRLASRIAHDEVAAAAARAEAWLRTVDPTARRWQFLRGVAAGLAFNLLLAAGIGIAALAAMGWIGP